MIFSCSKKDSSPALPATNNLIYGDSIFYIRNQSTDYLVSPVQSKGGTYRAFPEGLNIDNATGTINVSKSETGMRYKVSFISATGDTTVNYVVISGINFPDKYYKLAAGDSVAFPVYNANSALRLPPSSFDEDKVATNSGCAIKTNNGQINLTESIRNGLFGATPQNNTKKGFNVKYRLDDQSGKALNSINILIYYFNTMSDVTPDLLQTVIDHQIMTLQPNNTSVATGTIQAASKPRPPCIVVIGH